MTALATQCLALIAVCALLSACSSGGGKPPRSQDERAHLATAASDDLEGFFVPPLGYDAAFGAILIGDLQISPGFSRREVEAAIIGFLKREPNAKHTAIGSGDLEDTRVRSVDFWAVVLQEVTSVQSDGPINTRVAPGVRDLSIRGLVDEVERLHGRR